MSDFDEVIANRCANGSMLTYIDYQNESFNGETVEKF